MKPRRSFPQCKQCINRTLDPFACMGCDMGSNFEPEIDDAEVAEVMNFHELVAYMRDVEDDF